MIRLTVLTIFSFLLVFPSLAHAKGSTKVGDTIPHDLKLKDHNGKMRSFSGLTGDKGLVLVFVRSAEWCPFCQKQIIDLSKNIKKFTDEGYNVASVSYDPVEQLKKFATKNNPKITMLSDPASESIRAFGILNVANAKGTFSYGIPYPGTYIVSKDKKVQAKFFNDGFKDRVTVKQLVAEIKKLNPPPAPVYESLDNMGQDPIDPNNNTIDIPEKITDPIMVPDEVKAPEFDAPAVPETPAPAPAVEEMVKPETAMPDKVMPPKELVVPEAPAFPDPAPVVPEVPEPAVEPKTPNSVL